MKHRSLLTGGTLAILAVLFVAVVVLSSVLLRGARLDLTENRLYTLSQGTRDVLGQIEEPINLYFYWSERTTRELPQLQPVRTYANRVRELLEELEDRAGGKIRLHVIDPLPFSDEEDEAAGYGLQAVPVSAGGEKIYFGLVGTNATDGQMIVPFFQPDKESFLEYDLAKLIHSLTTTTKPVVGLISGLELGPGFDPATRQVRQGWAVHQSLQELFELRTIEPTAKTIDAAVQTLIVVHPKTLSDDLLYAIDQFVLRGGRLLLFVDPNAELDTTGADPENPAAAMFADRSSKFERLFSAWGVEFDSGQVLLDAAHALEVQPSPNAPPVRHLAILGFPAAAMSQEDVVTAQLGTVNLASAGVLRLKEGSALKLVPLVQSSAQSMLAPTERAKTAMDPAELFAGFKPTGQTYVVAGRLQGPLKTAFADRSGEGHLAESKAPAEILVVADTDVLTDRLWVQVQNFFGQSVMNAFANNGDFVVNAVDNLTGSSALISVRGRATSARPFDRVQALRRSADDRFRVKERELNERLAETERKLNELQQGKTGENALILSPEQRAELERFQEEKLEIRRDLRQVRRQLDADIEALGTRLKLINILLVPLLFAIAALAFHLWRRRRVVA